MKKVVLYNDKRDQTKAVEEMFNGAAPINEDGTPFVFGPDVTIRMVGPVSLPMKHDIDFNGAFFEFAMAEDAEPSFTIQNGISGSEEPDWMKIVHLQMVVDTLVPQLSDARKRIRRLELYLRLFVIMFFIFLVLFVDLYVFV